MASFFGFARGQFPNALLARGHSTARGGRSSRAMSQSELTSLINGEVIPRMVALNGLPAVTEHMVLHDPVVEPEDVDAVVVLALGMEADLLMARLDGLLARGVGVDAVLVDVLAPAARAIGLMWETDQSDFFEVTMGVWRLQEAAYELSTRSPSGRIANAPMRRILISGMPGEEHGFGAIVLAQLFEHRGWEVDRLDDTENSDLTNCVAKHWYDVVGLTVGCRGHIGALPSIIRALRSVSRNPRLKVMVGGQAIGGDAGLATELGADGTAIDARAAVDVAASLVDVADVAAAIIDLS